MTDNTHIDWDDEAFDNVPKALRDLVKKQSKQLEDLAAERDAARTQAAQVAVANVLSSQGFANPKRVEAAILSDRVDVHDSNALNAWLQANGNDFAKGQSAPVGTPPKQEPDVSADAQAYGNLSVPGAVPDDSGDSVKKVEAQITPDMTSEQIRQLFLEHGA